MAREDMCADISVKMWFPEQEGLDFSAPNHLFNGDGYLWISKNINRSGSKLYIFHFIKMEVTPYWPYTQKELTVEMSKLYDCQVWENAGEGGIRTLRAPDMFTGRSLHSMLYHNLTTMAMAYDRHPDGRVGGTRPLVAVFARLDGKPGLFAPGAVYIEKEKKDMELKPYTAGGLRPLPKDPADLLTYVAAVFGEDLLQEAGIYKRYEWQQEYDLFHPRKERDKAQTEKETDTGKLLNSAAVEFSKLSGLVMDQKMVCTFRSLSDTVKTLAEYVREHPDADTGRLMNYYLPLAQKFAAVYVETETGGKQTEKAFSEAKKTLPEIADTIRRIYDELKEKEDRALYLDLSSDSAAFHTMAARDGFARKTMEL